MPATELISEFLPGITLTPESMMLGIGGLILGFILGFILGWYKYYWKHRHAIETFKSREIY